MNSLISQAVDVLRKGGVIAFPTETVYGLGANAEDTRALEKIFLIKGRPFDHPLIVHIRDAAQLGLWAVDIPEQAYVLAQKFWPGPLTLILKRSDKVSPLATGGAATIALRVPAHALALELLTEFGGGIAAPSANRFGSVSPTTVEHVRSDLGDNVDYFLDGGPCAVGIESTIVDLSSNAPTILRPGAVIQADIESALHQKVSVTQRSHTPSPGQHANHYAPAATLYVARNAAELLQRMQYLIAQDQRAVALCSSETPLDVHLPRLALSSDANELARALYTTLRAVDAQNYTAAVALLPAEDGLGLAIIDRLQRAAQK